MLLRASAKANEEEIGMEGVMDDSEVSQVPDGVLLGEFTEAVVRRDPDLAAVRERVVEAMGPEAMVDAAAVVANFQRMVRIADGIGIPIDESWRGFSAELRDDLGVGEFASSANTPG
jgi:hypothetical protein